jgi:hypothetical protein
MAKPVFLLSLALAAVGFGAGYSIGYSTLGYVLMHIGGVGSLGVLASSAGHVALRKGYRYWPAYILSLSSSVLLGTIGAYLVSPEPGHSRPAACGGSLSLVVALVFLAIWGAKKRRSTVAL